VRYGSLAGDDAVYGAGQYPVSYSRGIGLLIVAFFTYD
jgi:hypothetical protein